MKKINFFYIFIFLITLCLLNITFEKNLFAGSSFKLKNPPTIHLNHLAVDLIDVARFEIEPDTKVIPLIDYVVKELGDTLSDSGFQVLKTDQILASGISSTASYSYGNFLVKIAESTGTRLIEVRIPDIEKQILSNDPNVVMGMPFKYIVFTNEAYEKKYVYICLVDPISYTKQFHEISDSAEDLLKQARSLLINKVKEAHPLTYFDPQSIVKKIKTPDDIAPVVTIAEVQTGSDKSFKTIDDVVKAVETGDLILFRGTPDEHAYKIGGSHPDYQYLKDNYTFYKGFLCFPRFSAIKDGWYNDAAGKKITVSEFVIKDKTDAMHNLVPNSIIQVYGRSCAAPEQKLKFETSKGAVYMLQVFSAYIHPAIMNTGLWHFASIPLSVIFYEKTPGVVAIEAQNPVFMMERYFQDVTEEMLYENKASWNADSKSKTYWPEMTKREMGEYVLNEIKEKVANALAPAATLVYPKAKTEKLVSPKWVKDLIDTNNYGKPFLILETGWGAPDDTGYSAGHIPGAIHVNTDEIEYDDFIARTNFIPGEYNGRSTTKEEDAAKGLSETDTLPKNYWSLYPEQYLTKAFAFMGITTDTLIVVYGAPIAATRVLHALYYVGVKDVRYLNGGYNAWVKAGYPTENTIIARKPVSNFGTSVALHPEYNANESIARDVVNGINKNAVIADIREYDEYLGKTAPYSEIPVSARIKGAVYGYAGYDGEGTWGMGYYVNADETFKPLMVVEDLWKKQGITKDKEAIFYCGSGWRSSLSWFFGYMMGWEKIRNFDGGFYVWAMGPNKSINPIIDEYPNLP